jgi:hypothetical protein
MSVSYQRVSECQTISQRGKISQEENRQRCSPVTWEVVFTYLVPLQTDHATTLSAKQLKCRHIVPCLYVCNYLFVYLLLEPNLIIRLFCLGPTVACHWVKIISHGRCSQQVAAHGTCFRKVDLVRDFILIWNLYYSLSHYWVMCQNSCRQHDLLCENTTELISGVTN